MCDNDIHSNNKYAFNAIMGWGLRRNATISSHVANKFLFGHIQSSLVLNLEIDLLCLYRL